jgi:hypothetical protein
VVWARARRSCRVPPTMKIHRLPAVALAVSSLLAMAWALGAGACSAPQAVIPNCFVPNLTELGADGRPDPCHCNIAPPYADSSCPCTGNQLFAEGLTGVQVYQVCMSMVPDAGDAAEGGPLPACNGACWPIPPPEWTPMLLWIGAESDAPPCPPSAPAIVYDGYGPGTFAEACTSNASGACPDLADVCGPASTDGFWLCIYHEGDVPCLTLGPYAQHHVFYSAAGQPIDPTTFCCLLSPSFH